jgi:hypothetical protein
MRAHSRKTSSLFQEKWLYKEALGLRDPKYQMRNIRYSMM